MASMNNDFKEGYPMGRKFKAIAANTLYRA
jgi:hypothetical protein